MRVNIEMRAYLEELLDHERACDAENCGLCRSAHEIYEVVRGLVFSSVAYPHIRIAVRRRATGAGNADIDPAALSASGTA